MMCASRWRQMRIWGIERAAVTQEMLNQVAQLAAHDTSVEVRLDTPAKAALGFRSLADNSRTLDLINRYEGSNSRLFFRSLRQLMALRANPELLETEPTPEEEPTPEPPEAPPPTLEAPNGEAKPNVDFPEQNQEFALLKNEPEMQAALNQSSPSPAPQLPAPQPLASRDITSLDTGQFDLSCAKHIEFP
jgi:hypothetical protein